MLIRPTPFPDEQDQAYLGRVMRLNGVTKEKEIDSLMREWAGVPGSDWRDIPRVVLLSKVAGMSVTEFVTHHTSLPLRRGITSYQPEVRHGCELNLRMLWSTAMRQAREGAYFCKHCVAEDLAFHGQSYWRRGHQIPGAFWCEEHSESLCFVAREMAFLSSPASQSETAERVAGDWVRAAMENPVVSRYLGICRALMNRDLPLNVRNVSQCLREAARCKGFQVNNGVVKYPLLSDRAIEELNRPWLATVLPALAVKKSGMKCSPIDGIFYMKTSASSTMAYALACALLFDSEDEVLNVLTCQSTPTVMPRRKRMLEISPEDLLTAYISARGDYSKAAKRFECVYQTITNRYAALGLPNLACRGSKRPLDALYAFYVEEELLADSARAGGLGSEAMEDFVRHSGPGLKDVLKEICHPKGRGSGTRRLQRINPTDVPVEAGEIPVRYPPGFGSNKSATIRRVTWNSKRCSGNYRHAG